MNKIGLAVYGLNIYNARRRKKMLDTVDSGIEFLDILEGFLNEGKKEFDTDNHAETVFRVENTERNEIFNEEGQKLYSYISGVVKTGEFGTESELVNRKTKKVTHNKTIDEAEVMPFAFFVAMPCGNIKRGIIILQTEGRYGMKMSFEKRLKKYMRNLYPDLDFAIGTISPKEYIERYLRDGFLKEIRMIKYGIPNDVSERNGLSKKPDANIYEERIIHNPLGFLDAGAEKIRETLNNQRLFTSIVEVPGFDYDKLKFKFSQGKTNKTIDMTNLDSITIIEDITDKVGVKNGHPLYSAVKEEMKRTAEEYLNGMGRYERDDEMKQVIEWFMGPNGILCILVIIFAFIHWGLKIRYLSIKNIVMNHINCFRNPNGKLLVVPVFIYMIMPLFIAIYIAKNKIVTADILNILTIIISILTAMLFTLLTVIIDMKNKIKVDNKYSGVEAQNIIQALKETYYTIMFEIFISILLLILCLINVFTSEYTFLQSILIYYFSLLMIMNLLMILKRISAVLDVEIEK